jgi:hypothetical protein
VSLDVAVEEPRASRVADTRVIAAVGLAVRGKQVEAVVAQVVHFDFLDFGRPECAIAAAETAMARCPAMRSEHQFARRLCLARRAANEGALFITFRNFLIPVNKQIKNKKKNGARKKSGGGGGGGREGRRDGDCSRGLFAVAGPFALAAH